MTAPAGLVTMPAMKGIGRLFVAHCIASYAAAVGVAAALVVVVGGGGTKRPEEATA